MTEVMLTRPPIDVPAGYLVVVERRRKVIMSAVPELALAVEYFKYDPRERRWVMEVRNHKKNTHCVWAFEDDGFDTNSLSAAARECIIMAIQNMVHSVHHHKEEDQ